MSTVRATLPSTGIRISGNVLCPRCRVADDLGGQLVVAATPAGHRSLGDVGGDLGAVVPVVVVGQPAVDLPRRQVGADLGTETVRVRLAPTGGVDRALVAGDVGRRGDPHGPGW